MKRVAFLISVILLAGGGIAVPQESPADIVQRQANEERAKRLAAEMELLREGQQTLQTQMQRLEQEIGKLREELARAANSGRLNALEERLRSLANSITEVDRKRQADDEKLASFMEKTFARLEKQLALPPGPRPPASSGPTSVAAGKPGGGAGPSAAPSGSGKLLEYTVVSGDTLSAIIAKVRKEAGLKVTQKQVENANPGVNWNRLQINQKIFIPAPAQ
jgi:nucleoid-associated protein YgaU